MASPSLPHFVIEERFQKGGSYRALLTDKVLADISRRLTGSHKFTVTFEPRTNVGRLAMLYYRGKSFFVSISEVKVESRNASFQSFPSALSRYVLATGEKEICYYIHPEIQGRFTTDYFMFMYRLMKTAGVNLMNVTEHVAQPILPFSAPEDVIAAKAALRTRAPGNNSTYVTRGGDGATEVYGKTYGANKYETTLICLALARIATAGLRLYQIEEGGLKAVPLLSRQAIRAWGGVIEESTPETEAVEFRERNSLRSIRFAYNLLEKFETKRCAFCACAIPQIVQGAHIWPVAAIKQSGLPFSEQLNHALSGHNGLWLCENHHKLLDSATLYLHSSGRLFYRRSLGEADTRFLQQTTPTVALPDAVLDPRFLEYLTRRNATLVERDYAPI
jgi:hypothetical protein